MMPFSRFVVLILLVHGVILMGASTSGIAIARACPLYCLQVEYVTCNSSGQEKLAPACNCCLLGKKDCDLHLSDGTLVHCA